MFFRREKPHVPTFSERVSGLQQLGFTVKQQGGRVRVSNAAGIGAMIEDGGDAPHIGHMGLLMGDEIGALVHGGYQMFFQTPSGRRAAAQAHQLKALHAFDEDLREGLGLSSLYNTSLGTTCEKHMYDRVEGR